MKLRLAFREEGEFWNAYLALPETMKDAKLVGCILMGTVRKNPDVKRDFMEVMKLILSKASEEVTGEPVMNWDERKAPEGKRSGSA